MRTRIIFAWIDRNGEQIIGRTGQHRTPFNLSFLFFLACFLLISHELRIYLNFGVREREWEIKKGLYKEKRNALWCFLSFCRCADTSDSKENKYGSKLKQISFFSFRGVRLVLPTYHWPALSFSFLFLFASILIIPKIWQISVKTCNTQISL